MDISGFRHDLSWIAVDHRNRWKNGLPSDDAIRTYRPKNRVITYRRHRNNEAAKIKEQCSEHIQIYFDVMDMVNKRHYDILREPNKLLNLDETDVDATMCHTKHE